MWRLRGWTSRLLIWGGSLWLTGLSAFALLAVPTTLMGATLPILVIHINQKDQHIGRSVGNLYFANTMGAALGATLAGFWLLRSLTIDDVLALTAIINVSIGFMALGLTRRHQP